MTLRSVIFDATWVLLFFGFFALVGWRYFTVPPETILPQRGEVIGGGAVFREARSGTWTVIRFDDAREGRLDGYHALTIGQLVCVRGASRRGSSVIELRLLPETDCDFADGRQP